jgi:hypothetical protein
MGKRSGMAGETLPAKELTLDEMNRQVAFLEHRYRSNLNASLKRQAFAALMRLEAERERLHGIPAQERKLARRK